MSKEILDLLDIQTSSKVSTLEKCGVETFAFLPVTGDLEKLVPFARLPDYPSLTLNAYMYVCKG